MATGKCCTTPRGEDSALRVSAQAQSCTRVGSLSRVMHLRQPPPLPTPRDIHAATELNHC